jgi:glycerol transport system permease protein
VRKAVKPKVLYYLIPMLALMFLSAFVPIFMVVNYSTNVMFAGVDPQFTGWANYREVLHDPMFRGALLRQFAFTFEVVSIELVLGLLVALAIPRKGWWVAISFVILGIPMLIPGNVVGVIWKVFVRLDIGVLPRLMAAVGYTYNPFQKPFDAWSTVVLVDIWHWTSLFTFLFYAGLRAIPEAFYQAAKIDRASAWRIFRFVTLPNLRYVLIIGVLMRVMDSFNVYSEPYTLTGGAPGNTTMFLSLLTVRESVGAFNLGYGSALSLIYFLIVIIMCYILYTAMLRLGGGVGK